MWYGLLADFIVTIHIAYVAYITVGLALVLAGLWRGWGWVRNPWFRLTHLAAILVVVFELIFKASCPLTAWELALRSLAGQPVSEATFVGRLMHFFLFDILGTIPAWVTTALYVGFALAIAAAFVLAPPRWRPMKHSS